MSAGKITRRLREVASARSGDKGNHANIGVVAKEAFGLPDTYWFHELQSRLTAVRVQDYFRHLGITRVVRYDLPNVLALNFVLFDALDGGASRSLRIDTQGKLLATSLLDITLRFEAPI